MPHVTKTGTDFSGCLTAETQASIAFLMKTRIKQFREAAGISQDALAAKVGTSKTSICRLEAKMPVAIDSLRGVAEALDVSLMDLIEPREPRIARLEQAALSLPESDLEALLDMAQALAERRRRALLPPAR
jgi:transcriptional regulator with XRE-family HTH domain